MAYAQDFGDDDEMAPGAAPAASGGSTVSPTGAAPSSTPAQPSKSSGSGFTNLTNYVNANAGASEGMAKTVTGGIDNKLAGAKDGATSFETNAKKAIQGGTVQAGMTGTYNGPSQVNDLSGYSQVGEGFKAVDDSVKALGSTSGLAQTAKSTFGDNKYSKGENTLDGFLLGSGKGAEHIGQYADQYSKSYQPPTPKAPANYLRPPPGAAPAPQAPQAPAATTPGQGWTDIVAGLQGGIADAQGISTRNNNNALDAKVVADKQVADQAAVKAGLDAAAVEEAKAKALDNENLHKYLKFQESLGKQEAASVKRKAKETGEARDGAIHRAAVTKQQSYDPVAAGWTAMDPDAMVAAKPKPKIVARDSEGRRISTAN